MKEKYASWSGTRQDLINEIHKLEEKNPQAYKMYSKNTGKWSETKRPFFNKRHSLIKFTTPELIKLT